MTAQMNASQTATVRSTSAALGRANQQLTTQGLQLQSSEQRRADAEKRAAQATADLQRIGSVKQEARGMVITLSGSVLFASAKWELLPEAQVKLGDVANALTEQDPDSKMVVEGHTDSQGTASFNQDLSQKRADAVRTYLVSRGIAGDRVTARRASARRGRSRTTCRRRGARTTDASRLSCSRRPSRSAARGVEGPRGVAVISGGATARLGFARATGRGAAPIRPSSGSPASPRARESRPQAARPRRASRGAAESPRSSLALDPRRSPGQ